MEREPGEERLARELGQLAADLGPALMPAGQWELLRSVAALAAVVFGARACSIALLDESAEELRFEASSRGPDDPIIGVSLPLGRGIAGWAASSGQAIAVDDVTGDPRFARDVAEAAGYMPTSILAMPIEGEDDVLGVIEVLDRRPGPRDMEMLGLFASGAALAIHDARVFSNLAGVLFEAAAAATADRSLAQALARQAASAPAPQAELAELAAAFAELGRLGPAERAAATRLVTHFLDYVRARDRAR